MSSKNIRSQSRGGEAVETLPMYLSPNKLGMRTIDQEQVQSMASESTNPLSQNYGNLTPLSTRKQLSSDGNHLLLSQTHNRYLEALKLKLNSFNPNEENSNPNQILNS